MNFDSHSVCFISKVYYCKLTDLQGQYEGTITPQEVWQ
jgi:hypothetical protein